MISSGRNLGDRHNVVILIVEDEPLQRLEMIDLVEDAGFTVVGAWDANHAISILERRSDVRVVFTDIDMPGSLSGLRLAENIRDRWPPIEIIVTTAGFAPDVATLPARTVFIPKPINADDALRAIQRLTC